MNWPEQAAVVRVTAKNATNIRKAFNASMDGDAITASWFETHPAGGSVSPQMARDWALAHVHVNKKPIELALSRTYADAYVLGDKVAKARLLGLTIGKAVNARVVDWANWIPGNASAAALVKPEGGLRQLLDNTKVTITNDVVRTKLDRIGTSLASSLERGLGARETATAINEIIGDPQHAMVIARTEMARAVSVATRDRYEAANVQQVEWLVAEGCEDCQENADASPIGIDETFPTGDAEPPAHPNCMCALAPVFDDSNLPELTDEEQAAYDETGALQDFPAMEDVLAQPQEVTAEPLDNQQIERIVETPRTNNDDIKGGDPILYKLQEAQGFNGLPALIDEAKFNELADQGWTKIYRGVRDLNAKDFLAPKYVEDFKTGVHFPGLGIYGNGTYTSNNIVRAGNYAEGMKANLIEMALSPSAKIADYDKLMEIAGNKLGDNNSSTMEKVLSDMGRFATSLGYDAIKVTPKTGGYEGEFYYVVLNRTKVAVVK